MACSGGVHEVRFENVGASSIKMLTVYGTLVDEVCRGCWSREHVSMYEIHLVIEW